MSQMVGLTKITFLTYILPPLLCQYLMGVLVQLKGTRTYRLALLPIIVGLAWRATSVDMLEGDHITLLTQMCIVVTRSIVWAFARVQYQRQIPGDRLYSDNVYMTCRNTWDLLFNQRGIGWNWPRGLFIPKPPIQTDSRIVFTLSTGVGFLFHAVLLDACLQTIRNLSPETFGSAKGGSLFDHTLSPILELLRAILVTFLTGATAYLALQHAYQLLAVVCVIFLQQHPSQWPPLFDAPWLSTSLSVLWGRRWHQLMRDSVLNLGYEPLNYLFGRVGGLFGAFLVSGIFHGFDLGRRGYSFVCLRFWAMNAIGVILERLWKKTTGRRVDGIWGWMWVAGWLFLSGVPMANAYAEVGRLGALSVAGGFKPSLALVAFVRKIFDMAGSVLE